MLASSGRRLAETRRQAATDCDTKASNASVETVSSSNCDSQSVPVIAAPDLAAVLATQNVTDVLLANLNALLVHYIP